MMWLILSYTLSGKVVDSQSGEPMPYAIVILYSLPDTLRVGGEYADKEGRFVIRNIKEGEYVLSVDFIGYKRIFVGPIAIRKDTSIGDIRLSPQPIKVGEIVSEAEPERIIYKPDRKVITPSSDVISKGGNAAEALKGVPGVEVDAFGNVSIRGSGKYILFVDGHPTDLTLKDIPASQVEKIEIITNPGAEYDAEGSAIINVILRRRTESGYFVSTNFNASNHGTLKGDVSASLSLNGISYFINLWGYSEHKIFSGYERYIFGNSDSLNMDVYWDQWYKGAKASAGVQTRDVKFEVGARYGGYGNYIETERNGIENGKFFEYVKNMSKGLFSSLLISKGIASGILNFEGYGYYSLGGNGELVDTTEGYGMKSNNFTGGYEGYISLRYSIGGVSAGSKFLTSSDWFKNTTSKIGTISFPDIPEQYLPYKENIYAAFITFSSKVSLINYKVGLRSEFTDRKVDTIVLRFLDVFPSFHISTNIYNASIFLSFSRRIWRPPSYMIYPIYIPQNSKLVQVGSPELLPEYYYNFQIGASKVIGPAMVGLEGYYDITQNIQDVREGRFENYDVSLYKYISTESYGKKYGAELSIQLSPLRFINLAGALSYMRYSYEDVHSDYLQSYVSLSLSVAFTQLQIRYFYASTYRLIWGDLAPIRYVDIGINANIRGINIYAGMSDPFLGFREDLKVYGDGIRRHKYIGYDKPVISLMVSYNISRNFKESKIKEVEEMNVEGERFLIK